MKSKIFFLLLITTIGIITLLAASDSFSPANAQITGAFNGLTDGEKINYLKDKFEELRYAFDNPTEITQKITVLENRILELESTPSDSCDGSIEMVKIISGVFEFQSNERDVITHHTPEELFISQYEGYCVSDVNIDKIGIASGGSLHETHIIYIIEYAITS